MFCHFAFRTSALGSLLGRQPIDSYESRSVSYLMPSADQQVARNFPRSALTAHIRTFIIALFELLFSIFSYAHNSGRK
jgi:hypothetical protein